MIQLWQVRDWLRSVGDVPRRMSTDLAKVCAELSPVFVIGGNRSGTSVATSILSQHPDLEGLFGGPLGSRYDAAGHSIGFCESMHVWHHLAPDDSVRRPHGDLPYWALPNYIGLTYRDRAKNDRERHRLAWAVERHRRTNKVPLLKDQFNTLRVGLIADVFPRARFLLVSRSWQDFTTRSLHKWANDGSGTSFERPRAGLHWHTVNLVARYDLEIHAPGRYATVWLDTLHEGEAQAQRCFDDITSALALPAHKFSFTELAKHFAPATEPMTADTAGLADIPLIVDSERRVLDTLGRKRS
jgi:hypothetical protein